MRRACMWTTTNHRRAILSTEDPLIEIRHEPLIATVPHQKLTWTLQPKFAYSPTCQQIEKAEENFAPKSVEINIRQQEPGQHGRVSVGRTLIRRLPLGHVRRRLREHLVVNV